eukprot:2513859-Rhodomonas_salina.2
MEPAVLRLRCYAAMAMMLRERYYDATAETMCGLGQGSVGRGSQSRAAYCPLASAAPGTRIPHLSTARAVGPS